MLSVYICLWIYTTGQMFRIIEKMFLMILKVF